MAAGAQVRGDLSDRELSIDCALLHALWAERAFDRRRLITRRNDPSQEPTAASKFRSIDFLIRRMAGIAGRSQVDDPRFEVVGALGPTGLESELRCRRGALIEIGKFAPHVRRRVRIEGRIAIGPRRPLIGARWKHVRKWTDSIHGNNVSFSRMAVATDVASNHCSKASIPGPRVPLQDQ